MVVPHCIEEIGEGDAVNINFFKNKVVAFDAYYFLHIKANTLAIPLLINHDYKPAFNRLLFLIRSFLKVCKFVYLVWDGDLPLCKSVVTIENRKKREKNYERGL